MYYITGDDSVHILIDNQSFAMQRPSNDCDEWMDAIVVTAATANQEQPGSLIFDANQCCMMSCTDVEAPRNCKPHNASHGCHTSRSNCPPCASKITLAT